MFDINPMYKSLLVGAVLAILWALEAIYPMFHFKKGRVKHDASNITLGVLNAMLVGFIFAGLIVSVTEWAAKEQFGLLNIWALNPYVELLIGLLMFDCWQYCWHRLNHKVGFFWRFHAVHHSDAAMDASTAVRFHTVEIIYSASIRLLVLPLLGLSVSQLVVYELILLPIILFHHSNIAIPAMLDKCLRVFIVTPRMHWVHHSDIKEETDSNYSSLLSVWDRLFASFRLREDPQNIRLGLGGKFDQLARGSLLGILKQPFNKKLYATSSQKDKASIS
ncbi:MAG: Sterol desaturase [Cycloclasticus sp. Phe_18]|nr:MAG: Sterol desaturase [Cycloclasticus sp. Phe_18]